MIERAQEIAAKIRGKFNATVEQKREWYSLDPRVRELIGMNHALRYTPKEIGNWERWAIGFLQACRNNNQILDQILEKCSPIKISAALEMLKQFSSGNQGELINGLTQKLRPLNEDIVKETEQRSSEPRLVAKNLNIFFGKARVVTNANVGFHDREITAVIGPSGSGKSTLIRALNRMHEVSGNKPSVEGEVLLDGKNIYTEMDPMMVRRIIGMVFQKPNPLPHMSIYGNTVAGYKLNTGGSNLDDIAEITLKKVGLWEEVKTRLLDSGTSISGGQQQRLCIARAIAVNPQILLLDEPCSALDPEATEQIEKLLKELKRTYTIVIVTHNIRQAKAISKYIVVVMNGQIIDHGKTNRVLKNPKDPRILKFIREDEHR